jgi:hypothetical protein
MNIAQIIFWLSIFFTAFVYISELFIQKKVEKLMIKSSTMIVEASRIANPEVPKQSTLLIEQSLKLKKWQVPLLILRYCLILIAVSDLFWFV